MPGALLLIAVIASLVAMGGTGPRGEALSAAAAIVACAVTAEWALRRGPESPVRLPLAIALAVAAAVALSQSIPLPSAIGALVAPATHRVWTSAPFDAGAWHPLSIAPDASRSRGLLFAAAALLHVAAAWWIGAGRRQRLALGALVGTATAICAAAIAERAGAPALWLTRFSQPEQALGPFPNRNDLGVLAAAAAPLAAAALLGPLARISRKARSSAEGWGAALRSGPDAAIAAACAGALALLAGAVFVSRSQSGLFALVAGLGLFAGAAWFRTDARRWALAGAIGVVGIAACASSRAGNGPDASPLSRDLAVRQPLWERTTAVAAELPLTGAGAGAIDAALQLHPFPASPGVAFRAENDLLETAAELGAPATLAMLALGALWLIGALRAARESGDGALAAGASAGAAAALLVGSLGTFVISVPAMLLFAAAVTALGVPAPQGVVEGRRATDSARRKRLAAALAAGVIALPLLSWSPSPSLAAAREAERVALESTQPWIDAPEQLAAAERWYARRLHSRPTDAYARLGLASLLETRARDPRLTIEAATDLRVRAAALCAAARDMDPGDPSVDRYRIRRE